MNKPLYVNLPGDFVSPQPFQLEGAQFYNFLYDADIGALQQVCDAWFNTPCGGKVMYKPLLPLVNISFVNYRAAYPATPPWDSQGYVPYQETIFSFFVVRLEKVFNTWVAQQLCAFSPYCFVSNQIPLQAGRDVFGMPKTIAQSVIPANPRYPYYFSTSTQAIKTYNQNLAADWERILMVQQLEKQESPMEHLFADLGQLRTALTKALKLADTMPIPDLDLLLELKNFILEGELPFVSLKQFRDIVHADRACYQAIIEFTCQMTRFNGAGLLHGSYELHLPQVDFFPIAQNLGLKREGQQSRFAFWLDWDFQFQSGKEIWTPEA